VEDAIEQAVERVITVMRDNLGEPLTVDDMARAAMFSKFHFTRIFQRATGVSPGRFLSALRLQQAKRLLISTSLNVADISLRVGYNSVGTFSSRFSRSVGLSPTTYRRLGGFVPHIPVDTSTVSYQAFGTVHGHIWTPVTAQPSLIFVGLFPERVPEGKPISCTILSRPGHYLLEKVPEGVWYLLSQSVGGDTEQALCHPAQEQPTVGSFGPIEVRPGLMNWTADLWLKPKRSLDPPVLLALLDVRKEALRLLPR
jgi:AraC-like DNA-binding protein